MDREGIARELQALVGRCMSLETAARELGETGAAEDLKQARRFLVAAGQRLEPQLGDRSFLVAVG